MLVKNSVFLALFIVITIALIGCNTGLEGTEYVSTQGLWSKEPPIEFKFSPSDTLGHHNMFLTVRNDNTYPYSNLFLIAELSFPQGERVIDTLEYEMATPDGKWLGKGMGSIKENRLWYKENIVFPNSGVYTLRLSHAMRKNGTVEGIENLSGITDVGYEIFKKTD